MKTIESIQKIIKVGDSVAVTIPAKEAKLYGLKPGQLVRSSHEIIEGQKLENNIGIAADYDKFAKQYDSALKNLAGR
ncbi:hypothetical protein KBB49_00640 [Candidatus Saccharibacteria bacterium]|nr:hypothetical protein [Candidatus Saccharibacteria bacterium]